MRLKPDETLIRDESVFEPSYLPEDFLYRDSQMRELALCSKPALRGSKPQNVFMFGRPATGKTTAAKLMFSQLHEESDRILTIHINCHIYNSEYRILGEIHKKLFGFVPPDTGLPVAALYDKVFSRLEKEKMVTIVALDDMNFYDMRSANAILYDLVRSHEAYAKTKTAVWCISTKNEMHRLEDKVRSTLITNTVEFTPYSKQEMKEILKARATAGLFDNVITDLLLDKIAGHAADIRHGIELLKKAAALAENGLSRKILGKHVAAAIKSFELPVSSSVIDDKKILLDLVKKRTRESGELYEEYRKITGSSYATFYRVLQKLKKGGRIEIEHAERKRRGRTSRIRLK